MKREMLDRESEIKRDMLNREAQAKKDTIEAEIELQRLKLQTEEAKRDQEEENEENEEHTSYKATRPKIPAFIEEKDDIDAFLQRFERFAELNKWPATDWSLHLSALLRGKALEVYARLPAEDAKNYEQLKEALLRRYELSADGSEGNSTNHDAKKKKQLQSSYAELHVICSAGSSCQRQKKPTKGYSRCLLRNSS